MRTTLAATLLLPLALAAAPLQSQRAAGHPGATEPRAADSLLGPGISAALASYRVDRVADVRYALEIDVTARDTARGRVSVRFTRRGGGDAILDFRGPRLERVTVNGRAIARPEWNGAHLRVPAALLRAGPNEIAAEFAALVAPSGASVIRYHDAADDADYLYTLLVPADANQLFPCFDQPDLKARVTLALTTPHGWRAVANGPLAARDSTAANLRHRFLESEPISTYLVAFAAGPWTVVRDTSAGREIAMYVRRSRAAEAEADSLVSQNVRAARWLEAYFARPFPFAKLDFVLAPAFPFGGMEHPGAIFYSEERFVFRERPTTVQRIARANTIYHEIAHQWFGDLVTMRWFDDLWLKEGFATYMAAKMQAALDPASDAWKTFYLRNAPAAYEVDVSPGTTPVWQRLDNLDRAKSNYGPIVYNKAPAILKQLEYLVGEDAFRRGLRAFLERHAYGNATWRDLLDAIGEAADRPLEPWGEHFVLRPGVPVLEARMRLSGDTIAALDVVQRPATALSGDSPWPQRIEVLLGYADAPAVRLPVELADRTTAVPGAAGRGVPDFVFPNAGDHGYALSLLDTASVRWLERRMGEVDDALLRAMLWGAMWDLVREARLAPERWIALAVRELPRERDEQIAASLLPRLVRATRAYLPPARREAVLRGVEEMLRAAATDTTRPYGIRKAHLDALVAVAGSGATLAWLDTLLDEATVAGEPLRAPTRWSIVTTLVARGWPSADARLDAESARDTTSDGARRAFVAGAARPEPAAKREYFRRWFADSTLVEDWATASLGAFNTIDQAALTRAYLIPALDSLQWIQRHRRIFYLGAWLDAFLSGQTDPSAVRQVDDWLARHPMLAGDLRRKVLQYADELRRTAHIRTVWRGAPD